MGPSLIFSWILDGFSITYGLRFLNFSDIFFKGANASLFQKNLNVILYQNIAIVWFEFDFNKTISLLVFLFK